MHKVFVYGTLKRGFPNFAGNMEAFAFLGRYRTLEAYPLVVGGRWNTPCLIPEPGAGHRVWGELFTVDEPGLEHLDQLEGVGNSKGYARMEVRIETPEEDGRTEASVAWVYVKARNLIGELSAAPMEEYRLDPDYVIPSKRPGVF